MQDRMEQNALELLHAIREHHPDLYAGAWVNPYTAALEAGLDPESTHYTVAMEYLQAEAEGAKRRVLYGKTRKEVADKLARALADRASGYTFDIENMIVGKYLDRWLKDSDKGSVRTSTYSSSIRRSYLCSSMYCSRVDCTILVIGSRLIKDTSSRGFVSRPRRSPAGGLIRRCSSGSC
jgi:hypothetical protein